MNIASILRELRIKKGISQLDVANKLGVDNSYYARQEKRGNDLTVKFVISVAEILDTKLPDLFKDDSDSSSTSADQIQNEDLRKEIDKISSEKDFIANTYEDYINSSIKHLFLTEYKKNTNTSVSAFEDIPYSELKSIFQNNLVNNYLVFVGLKRNIIKIASLQRIFKEYMIFVDDQIKTGKKFSDYIKLNIID